MKRYLQATTKDSRPNHQMIFHVHKDKTDAIHVNLVDVANNFVREKASRKQLFGKFFNKQCPYKGVLCDKVGTNCGIVNSISICIMTQIFVRLMTYLSKGSLRQHDKVKSCSFKLHCDYYNSLLNLSIVGKFSCSRIPNNQFQV